MNGISTGAAIGLLLSLVAGAAVANEAPVVSSFPTVNEATLIADDSTVYTVTMTATDTDGYDDILDLRLLFNLIEDIESAGDVARGYLAWGQTDADVTNFGGIWVLADAIGGGRWGYQTNAWGGTTYFTPVDCTTSVAGAPTGGTGSRTVTWSFRVKPAWAGNPVISEGQEKGSLLISGNNRPS